MMDFAKACDTARKVLLRRDYKDGFCEICDIGDRWLFFSRMFDKGVIEYGNCPVAVYKETGLCEDFPMSQIDNYDLYYKSESIKVPEKYVLKD